MASDYSRHDRASVGVILGHSPSPTQRYMRYGPIRPMEEPGFLQRLFGRR